MRGQGRLADIGRIPQKPAGCRTIAGSASERAGQEIRFEVMRIVFQHPPEILPCIRKILKLVVEFAEKDSHFAVLRVSGKRSLQRLEATPVILLDKVLAALFDELREAALIFSTKSVQKRLLVRFEFFAFLALQQSLGN